MHGLNLTESWPGVCIFADYHLLIPANGLDVLADVKALFEYILTLPISHNEIFIAGFSGGAYPMRLAAVVAAEESKKSNPRFRVLGGVSYCGMGGDFLHDYWLTPRNYTDAEGEWASNPENRERMVLEVGVWRDGDECSNALGAQIVGKPHRECIWRGFHVNGSLNDAISGAPGVSNHLGKLSHSHRLAALPPDVMRAYPQAYFRSNASHVPPLLLVHGDSDTVVPFEESIETLNALEQGGGTAKLIRLTGANHSLNENQPVVDGVMEYDRQALEWMLGLVEAVN